MYNKILLASDGSEHSIRSAKHAIELAKNFNGTIEVVYVIDGQSSKNDVLQSASKYEIELKRKEKIKAVLDLLGESSVEYEVKLLHGEPGPTLIEFANANNFDCLVIGSRGLNKLQTMILGSVSHKVAKHVECPVLIVK
ncbi:universal stress protein [Virgibacillus sp. C22-A2]|uniref:Universal stress protein n=1 Tax=Virgibacillus tibetensis TaxID=3042313 RepID=A0ABU6KLY3_9BACI|nr:universal stress protein [Virgibacillus sp. C22-A2]